jgi:division protein CdvB (Snf7/Vps24/ESCRT-III family)
MPGPHGWQVTKSMAGIVVGMDSAMKEMDVEKVRRGPLWRAAINLAGTSSSCRASPQIAKIMDQFEKQFEDLDVR